MMEERLRKNDNIKTAMMLAVVLYHSCMFFTGTWFDKAQPIYKAGYLTFFAKYLNTFHVQTFVMAAGFLFYALRKGKNKYRNNLKNDALKRAKRLLLPYVCTIVFWVSVISQFSGIFVIQFSPTPNKRKPNNQTT